jgi:hypothetical protein
VEVAEARPPAGEACEHVRLRLGEPGRGQYQPERVNRPLERCDNFFHFRTIR